MAAPTCGSQGVSYWRLRYNNNLRRTCRCHSTGLINGEPQVKVVPSKSSRNVGKMRISRKVRKPFVPLLSVPVSMVSGRGIRIDCPPSVPRKLKMFQFVVTCSPWLSTTTHSKVTLLALTSLATTVLFSGECVIKTPH